jgi:hypothetical protein
MVMHLRFLIFAALTVAWPSYGQDFLWRGALAPGKTIEIKGVNGGIAAERSATNLVEVTARKHGRRSDPSTVRIELVESDSGVTVCAVYPSSFRPNECKPGAGGRLSSSNNDVKVHFTVKVPAGVRFVGRTVNGEVEALALASEVDAKTVNGAVRVSTSEHAQARTVNGSIDAALGSFAKPAEFETVNGGITVEMPSDSRAQVSARTVNGGITTDFPLTVQGRFVGRRVDGTIGGGGPRLALHTVNGGIRLRRSP